MRGAKAGDSPPRRRTPCIYLHTACRCRCCCCSVCCYNAVFAEAAVLLLLAAAVAVRHRVPDGQIWCWFIESDPSVFFLFTQTQFIFDVPRSSTVSPVRSRFANVLGNCGHAWSRGGRHPAAVKPPLYVYAMMIEVSSEQSTSQYYMHTDCCCRCCSVCCYSAAVAVRHRVPDDQICCWFI